MIESLDLPALPEGWVWTEVGDIGNIVTGTTPSKSKKEYYGNDFPFFKPTDLNNGYYIRKSDDGLSKTGIEKTRLLPAKSILVTCIGATIGKTGFIRTEGASNQQINAIIPEEHILPEFIYFMCISPQFQKSIIDNASATTLPILNKSKFMILPIPLPPLPEQQRIVAKVDELFTKLDAGVESLKNVKAQLRLYRQAVLKHAFKGKLTEEWRETHKDELEPASMLLERIKEERKKTLKEKYKELSLLDTSDLPELPDKWAWSGLRGFAEFRNGINFNKNQKGDKGILTIDVLNMYSKGVFVNLDKLYRVNKPLSDEYVLKFGDILFVRSSVKREGVGWASTFKEISEPVTFCGFIIRARLQDPQISPEYITYFLRTNFARELIITCGSQVTITNINQDSVGRIPVPLAPVAEQHKVVEEIELQFSVADDAERSVDQSLKQAERLRQSILKRAFEGKLVPQDLNDEPASVLLERIKAEREKREIEAKSKSKNKRKRDLVLKQRRFNDYVK